VRDLPEVFFSYAREDEARVAEIYRLVKSKGFRPWMDTRDIAGGEDWDLAIKRAIRRANFFLVFVSHFSLVKTGVLKAEMESGISIRQANLEHERFLIPVRLEECDLPDSLKPYQWINYFADDGPVRLLRALGYQPRRFLKYAVSAAIFALLCLAAWAIYRRAHDPAREFVTQRSSQGAEPSDSRKALIGVTLWELRPTREADPPAVREIIHPEQAAAEVSEKLTPVRSKMNLSLPLNAKFRIGIESSRPGYLYVIDRALYGSELTRPTLIFPTTRIRDGNNYISNGSSVELPSDYFELQSRRADYRGEQITILLTPKPLPLLIGREQLPLDEAQFNKWVHDWGVQPRVVAGRLDDSESTATPGEAQSRNNPLHNLTPQDPAPQNLYELPAKSDVPVLFHFLVSIGS
jgi:TIR domain